MKKLFILFLFFLVSISFSTASACYDNLTEFMTKDTGISLAGVFFFTIMIIGLAFVLSRITNNAALTIFYKDEMFHLIISAVMLASIGGVLFISCAVTTGFLDFALKQTGATSCYSGTESAQSVAQCSIKKIDDQANSMLKNAVKDSIKKEMESTLSISLFNPLTGGITVPIGAFNRTYALQLDMIAMTYIMPVVISLGMQRLFVDFSVDLIKYLLPIAFLFRIFPFTRKIGNLFIALSIVLYTVVPVMYALNTAMDEIVSFSTCAGNQVTLDSITLDIDDVSLGGCDSIYNFWNVGRLLPHAFFLPNLTLAIAITCLSAIDKALTVLR